MLNKGQTFALGTKFAIILTAILLLAGTFSGSIVSQRSSEAHLTQSVQTLSVAAKMLAVHLDEYMSRLLDELEHLGRVLAVVPAGNQQELLAEFALLRPELLAVRYAGQQYCDQ